MTYRDLNFLGMARPFSLNLEVNQRGYSGEAIYTDPWLFESDYQMRLRLYALTETLKGYSKNEIGFTPTLSKYVTDHWKLSAFLTGKYVAVHDIDIRPESLVGDKNYSVFSIGFSQSLDYRNNVTIPTRGFIFTTTAEFAPDGVGEISYFRALGAFSYYIPVTAKSTLALGARMGVITPLGGTELPIDERFFNGGATTVRSFSELTLGPKSGAGYPLGGQGFSIFNAEYTFPAHRRSVRSGLHGRRQRAAEWLRLRRHAVTPSAAGCGTTCRLAPFASTTATIPRQGRARRRARFISRSAWRFSGSPRLPLRSVGVADIPSATARSSRWRCGFWVAQVRLGRRLGVRSSAGRLGRGRG